MYAVALLHKSPRLLSGDSNGVLQLSHIPTNTTERSKQIHTNTIRDIAISSDDTTACTGSWDFSIALISLQSDWSTIRTFTGHTKNVMAVAYVSCSNSFASGGGDGIVCVWDQVSALPKHKLYTPCGQIKALVAHPHQPLVACGGSGNVVTIFSASDFSVLRHIPVDGGVCIAAFFNDNEVLVGQNPAGLNVYNRHSSARTAFFGYKDAGLILGLQVGTFS